MAKRLLPAITAKEEDFKGTITQGKLADLVFLNHNLDELELDNFHDVEINKTIIGGEVVYSLDK